MLFDSDSHYGVGVRSRPPLPAPRTRRRTRRALTLASGVTAVAVAVLALAACSTADDGDARATGDCPTTPVDVVVSVDQWGDIVRQLGGDCADVTTILASSSVDPHDYEPSPKDGVAFTHADVVVVNGVDYDAWASKLAASSAQGAAVVDAGDVVGAADGDNPHLWYSPTFVTQVADTVTAQLETSAPAARDVFEKNRAAFAASMKPYDDLVAAIKEQAADKTYAATESVFDYTAQAVGLKDVTPAGYARAAANETDPAPGDVKAFDDLLTSHGADVLVVNTQTEGALTDQVRDAAKSAGVPVVGVTETVAPDGATFQDWQVAQLTALAKALGVDA